MKVKRKAKTAIPRKAKAHIKKISSAKRIAKNPLPVSKALRASEMRYRRLFETAQDGILLLDASTGQITDVNPFLTKMLKYSREELQGKKLWQIGLFKNIASTKRAFKTLQERKYIRYENLPLESKDGRSINVEFVSNVYLVDREKVIQCKIRDITDRKRAGEALWETSQKLNAAQRISGVSNWSWDQRTGRAIWSDGLFHIYGRNPEDGVPPLDHWLDNIHPDDREPLQHAIQDALDGKRPYNVDYRLKRYDNGQEVTVHAEAVVERDANGVPLVMMGTVADITERKRVEEALRESETKYRELVEQATDGIFIADPNGFLILANPKSCEILGYTEEELLHLNITDTYPEEEIDLALERMRDARVGKALQFERRMRRKDGTHLLVEVNLSRLKNGNFQGFVHDITERKRGELALIDSARKLKTVFEILPVGASILDAERSIVYVNPALEKILGVSKERLFKGDYRSRTYLRADGRLMPPEELASVRAIKEQRAVHNVETGVVKENGKIVWTSVSAVPVGFPDWKVLVVTSDITDRKRAEEQLRQSEDRYRDLVEHSQDLICTHDLEGRLLSVNSTAVKMSGYSVDEIATMNMRDFLAPEVRRLFGQYLRRIRRDHFAKGQLIVQTKSGERRIWEYDNTLRTEGVGKPFVRGWARDTTERKLAEEASKRAEEALHLEKENFRRSLDESPLGVRIVTEDGDTLHANRAILDFYGYDSLEELRKTPLRARYTPESYAEFQKRKQQRERGDFSTSGYGISIIRRNGEVLHLQVNRKQVLWDGAKQFLVIYQDITERKRAEEALLESEKRHRHLFENMLEGYAHCRMIYENGVPQDFVYLDVNNAFEVLTGLKDVVGKKASEVIPGVRQLDPALFEVYGRVASSGEPERLEMFLESLGIWFSVAVYSSTEEYFVAIFDNINERKRMEESLRKERTLLSTIIETIPDEICLKDTDSRYILANRASVTALGAKSSEEMIGKTDLHYMRRDIALRLLAEEKQILESGKPSIGREIVRLDPKSGEISKCDLYTKVPIKEDGGQTIGLLVINTDITQRKRAEEKVRMSERRLRELAAHLESVREGERKHMAQEFHDQLGQTLTALKMDLTMLQRRVSDKGKELSRTTINVEIQSMQQIADHAIGSIREIMAELRPELLDQLGILPALEFEAEKFQRNSGISCVFTPLIEEIQLDQEKSIALFRIFQEALTNVARHAQATHIEVTVQRKRDDLILEISDDGIGITFEAENKARSFGLIGMRERALLLGGKLEITGIMGKGTKIAVRMPLRQAGSDGGAVQ